MFKTERERLEWCVETNTPMLLQKHGEFDSATGFGSIAVIDPEVYDAWHAETGGLGRYPSRAVAEQRVVLKETAR